MKRLVNWGICLVGVYTIYTHEKIELNQFELLNIGIIKLYAMIYEFGDISWTSILI
jgi:hypothetical protein